MVAISRVTVAFTGSAVVGPSSASFYTTGQVANLRNPVIDLWELCMQGFPSSCTATVLNTGETYEDSTGVLSEIWTEGTPEVIVGANSTATYARGVGGRIIWNTAGLTNNRRVRGCTYLVPFSTSNYDVGGTITDGTVTGLGAAAAAFVAATQSDFVIWTRPKNGAGGKSSGVTGSSFPDKVSTLRSRRV